MTRRVVLPCTHISAVCGKTMNGDAEAHVIRTVHSAGCALDIED